MSDREMHAFDTMAEPELAALFQAIAHRIGKSLPPNTGFILLAAPTNQKNGIAQYAGNCRREDAIALMEETVARFKTNDCVPRDNPEG